MLICIDAGHGKYTPGKRCLKSIDSNETREWVLNSRIANYVQSGLKAYNCTTMRVDDVTGETDVSLANRVAKANKAKADWYVSIHANAGVNGGSGGGICVYTAKTCSAKSTALQKAIYDSTVKYTGLKGNRSTPTPTSNFYVIKNTNMPAILGEFGFMDSTKDTPIILTDDFAQKCAKGIVEAIVSVAGLSKSGVPLTTPVGVQTKPTFTPYVVRITASKLHVRSGVGTSHPIVTSLKKGEAYTIVEERNGWGKLKSGLGWIKLSYTARVR
jgi:N-acetylmuramoyl-L-alanine amidase